MPQKRAVHAFSLIVAAVLATTACAERIDEQRSAFQRAEKALHDGDSKLYQRLRRGLKDYPLYPYLEYDEIDGRLGNASASDVERFLGEHADTPLAGQLRARWLDRLAAQGRWSDYLRFYVPTSDVGRQCDRLNALIRTGQTQQAFTEVAPLWLHGESRPKDCDPVFAAWDQAGHLTAEMSWRRIEKAMEANEPKLAQYLARRLAAPERVWVERWADLLKRPERAADAKSFASPHPYREAMLVHAVRRQARSDGLSGLHLWQEIRPRYAFSDAQVRATEQYIMRNLVRTPGDEAYAFVRGVEVGEGDAKAHEARIRAALLREDWRQVIRWIAALPKKDRDEDRWTYWLARALEGSGETKAAAAVYAKAATERTYYGFLAADRIGSDYHLDHSETPATAEQIERVAHTGGIARAQELFALGRTTEARREWFTAIKRMDAEQLKAAAKLAEQHGWHDRAIFTLARTGYWDDLELRFPMEHADLVERNAKLQGIDNAWIFAVMRQESAFMSNARSHAGALGLMQLMPATARNVARNVLKQRPPRRNDLLQPDTNIALGSAYLKQMKGRLGDSAVLATAAYNAGPHRVAAWLPERTLPADIWIELVPFDETRGYLRRVLAYTVIYEKRMGRTPTRLQERLHPVPPDLRLLGSREFKTASTG